MKSITDAGFACHRKTLPEVGLPLFEWAANKPPTNTSPSSLAERKFQRLLGHPPERIKVICELAGFKQSEAAHG